MKKVSLLAIMIGVWFGANLALANSESLIYVDLLKIFNKYQKTADYDKTLQVKQKKKQEELSTYKKEIEKMRQQMKLLKSKEQESKRKEIEKKAEEYNFKRQQAFLDLRKERDEKMKEILDDITKAVEKYAKAHRIGVVLKKASLIYGGSSLDKTEDILRILNSEYKKK